MATEIGRVYLDGCNYELAYDLLSQSAENNTSDVRLYGILHVTNNYVSWDSGSASVHTSGLQPIGTYYGRGDYVVITRDFTFAHDSQGKFENVGIGGSLRTTFVNGDVYGTMSLPKINRYPILTSGMNFNDEENPVYNITAFNTFPIRVKLEAGGNPQLIIRDLDTKGSINYTLELTEEERNTLRALCPNSNTLNVIETVCAMNGNTELNWSYKGYKMTIVNGNPVFSDFDIADVNPTTRALTGSTLNNVVNINGYSNIQATISTSNKAEAIKSATMNKYRFKIGDSSTDIAYSSEEVVNGTINNASIGIYEMYAIDSRNNSTLITKQATSIINYEKVAIDKQNCSFVRDDNQVGENAILTINGTFWNDNFGQVSNSLSVSYKLKKSDSSTWITGTTTITPTINNNDFTFTGMIASDNLDTTWDLDSSYNLEVIVSDELSSASVELILNSAVPTMSLDKNGVGIMCAYDSNIGGLLQVGGKVIDGGTILWTNSNPDNAFDEQDIVLSSSDYDYLEIIVKMWNQNNFKKFLSVRIPKNQSAILNTFFVSNFSTGECFLGQRILDYSDSTTYIARKCYGLNIGTTSASVNNSVLIPQYIIGYKTGLFE